MRVDKKNQILLFIQILININAMTFISVNTLIPYFLDALHASTFQISMVSVLASIGPFISLPFFSKKAQETNNRCIDFTRILILQRLIFLGFVVTIPLMALKYRAWTVMLFLVFWGIFNLFTGSYSPFYMGILSKILPENMRGRMVGYSRAMGNLTAIGTSYVISIIIDKIPFPHNYTVIFGVGTLLLLIEGLSFAFMKEPSQGYAVVQQTSCIQYIKSIPAIFTSNKKFVHLVIGLSFMVISNISLAFYAIYSIRTFKAATGDLAVFMIIMIISSILGNIILGFISDRMGHKFVLLIASICGIAASIAVLGIHNIYGVFAAFSFSSICSCGYFLSGGMLTLEISPTNQVSVYIGINTMITLGVTLIFTLLCGMIISLVSFIPVFVITGLSGLLSLYTFTSFHNTKIEDRI